MSRTSSQSFSLIISEKFVARNARIVHEDIDAAESLLDLFHEVLRLIEVCDVRLKGHDACLPLAISSAAALF